MRSDRNNRGFTLVELMTAMAITAIVTVQVLAMMSTQEKTYYAQKRTLESQVDSRLIADMIMRDARAAGFLVQPIVGIASRDGAGANADVICVSDPSVIAEAVITDASDRLDQADLLAALGTASVVGISDADKDIDDDGNDDFAVNSGIIISDGLNSHCARVTDVGTANQISFDPATPGGFAAATPDARATPAVIYEITANGLTRNTVLISPGVEDLQIQYGVDTTVDGILDRADANEYPIDDLSVSGSVGIELIEISVLSRTSRPDPDLNSPGRPAVANRAAAGVADAFRRRLVMVSASPRNLQ